jgi:hypothetical protein
VNVLHWRTREQIFRTIEKDAGRITCERKINGEVDVGKKKSRCKIWDGKTVNDEYRRYGGLGGQIRHTQWVAVLTIYVGREHRYEAISKALVGSPLGTSRGLIQNYDKLRNCHIQVCVCDEEEANFNKPKRSISMAVASGPCERRSSLSKRSSDKGQMFAVLLKKSTRNIRNTTRCLSLTNLFS